MIKKLVWHVFVAKQIKEKLGKLSKVYVVLERINRCFHNNFKIFLFFFVVIPAQVQSPVQSSAFASEVEAE